METLRHIVLFVHLVGFAVLFGAWAVQAFGGKREIVKLMHIGFTTAAVAGLALAAPWGLPDGVEMNYAKIGTKLVILLIIGAFLGIGQARQRKSGQVPTALFWGIGLLTLVNAGIAVIW
ncbi:MULTISPECIES: Fe-S protein [unclassified Microbacterium]|uniref:Fe-S protein n=1 Tax=unclassified Microbacterium TaxID=2609290 RepID=UPI0008FC377F|nr:MULTISPECIES: Fe-S protein [unclassified Microbacterium]OIU85741.1 Fe-S protein [Microbacterium sp. AR7-10]